MKRFNAFQLKFFMAMLMVLDHLDHIIFRDFFRLGGWKFFTLSQDVLHRSLAIWRSKVLSIPEAG